MDVDWSEAFAMVQAVYGCEPAGLTYRRFIAYLEKLPKVLELTRGI